MNLGVAKMGLIERVVFGKKQSSDIPDADRYEAVRVALYGPEVSSEIRWRAITNVDAFFEDRLAVVADAIDPGRFAPDIAMCRGLLNGSEIESKESVCVLSILDDMCAAVCDDISPDLPIWQRLLSLKTRVAQLEVRLTRREAKVRLPLASRVAALLFSKGSLDMGQPVKFQDLRKALVGSPEEGEAMLAYVPGTTKYDLARMLWWLGMNINMVENGSPDTAVVTAIALRIGATDATFHRDVIDVGTALSCLEDKMVQLDDFTRELENLNERKHKELPTLHARVLRLHEVASLPEDAHKFNSFAESLRVISSVLTGDNKTRLAGF